MVNLIVIKLLRLRNKVEFSHPHLEVCRFSFLSLASINYIAFSIILRLSSSLLTANRILCQSLFSTWYVCTSVLVSKLSLMRFCVHCVLTFKRSFNFQVKQCHFSNRKVVIIIWNHFEATIIIFFEKSQKWFS